MTRGTPRWAFGKQANMPSVREGEACAHEEIMHTVHNVTMFLNIMFGREEITPKNDY